MPKQDYILSEGFEDKLETAPIKTSVEKTSSDKTSSEKTSSDKKEDKEKEDATLSLKEDFDEFQTVQKKILESMNDLNPLLDKAEAFIQKYEQYKNVKDK
jgi:ribosome-binding protein aMBF1 (putative translation factor)